MLPGIAGIHGGLGSASGGGLSALVWSPSGTDGAYGSYSRSGGNLTLLGTGNPWGAKTPSYRSSGKYYFEVTPNAGDYTQGFFIIGLATQAISEVLSTFPATSSSVIGLSGNGNIYTSFTVQANIGAPAAGVASCVAFDGANARFWMRNGAGNWNNDGSANPATNTNGIDITALLANGAVGPFVASGAGAYAADVTANFGATTFAQTIPSGFVGWPP